MINKSIAKTVIQTGIFTNIDYSRCCPVVVVAVDVFCFAQKYEWLVAAVSNVKHTLSFILQIRNKKKKLRKSLNHALFDFRLLVAFIYFYFFQIENINSNLYSLEKFDWDLRINEKQNCIFRVFFASTAMKSKKCMYVCLCVWHRKW